MFGRKQKRIEELEAKLRDALNKEYIQKVDLAKINKNLKHLEIVNRALADGNRDLIYQLELLRGLLRQLRIEVKLPARTK